MKELWTDDKISIEMEIKHLIDNKIGLVCGRRGVKNMKRLVIHKIVRTKRDVLIVLGHPHEPTCSANSCSFFYQKNKNTLRMFECEQVKLVKGLFGYKIPTRIFNLHNRSCQRVDTPNKSSVSFSIQNKQKIYNGEIDNISIDGAKLLVNLPTIMKKDDLVENLTLTLYCHLKSIEETDLHIPQAKIIWLKCDEDTTSVLGVQFILKGRNHDKLGDYIDLRMMEDSTRAPDKS